MAGYVPSGTTDPFFAVQFHVALKGLQAGALGGLVVLAPVAWFFSGRRRGRSLWSYARTEPTIGAAIGAPLALGAGWAKLRDEPVEDRARRIAGNTGQQLCDRFAMVGAGAGALGGAVGFRVAPVLGFAQGGGLGLALGVIAYVVYSRVADTRV